MAQSLLRKTLKVFGLSGTTNDFEQFGSTAAAATNYTKDIPTIQSLAAWASGWRAALLASKAPVLQDMNAAMFVHSYLQGYQFQEGIPEYDAGTTYNKGSIVKLPYTGAIINTILFCSLIDGNVGNALPTYPNSNADWTCLGDLANLTPKTFLGLGRNRILNGAMEFDQMREGLSDYPFTNPETYTLDNMRVGGLTAASFHTTQATDSLPPGTGFRHALRIAVDTPHAVAAGDFPHIEIPVEGPQMSDFIWGSAGAQAVTLSFWALCSRAGTYSVSVINGADTIYYCTTYTIATANTWQYFTITIPGPTSGTWTITPQTFGVKVIFDLGTGSTYTASTANAWTVGAAWKVAGSASLMTNTDVLYLTGIQLEVGPVATPFEFINPSTELIRLQRYYWKSFPQGTPVAGGQGYDGCGNYVAQQAGVHGGGTQFRFPVSMGGSPSILTFNPITPNANWYNESIPADSGVPSVFSKGATGVFIYNPQVAGDTNGSMLSIHASASARLGGL